MAAAAGEARRVLVYGGRGALGSRCVHAFRACNWVLWWGRERRGRAAGGGRGDDGGRGPPGQPGRAAWRRPGGPGHPRCGCLHVHAVI